MPIIYQKWIKRADLKANPGKLYVFGDNLERAGYGGQAKEMRGEPNAIGIATKFSPYLHDSAFFTDARYDEIWNKIEDDLYVLVEPLKEGWDVVWPEGGIGSGLSQMPTRCPKLWKSLQDGIVILQNIGEWRSTA